MESVKRVFILEPDWSDLGEMLIKFLTMSYEEQLKDLGMFWPGGKKTSGNRTESLEKLSKFLHISEESLFGRQIRLLLCYF